MRGSGNACNSTRQRKSSRGDRSSLISSKISSSSLLVASMFSKGRAKVADCKATTAEINNVNFWGQIMQKLSSDKKLAFIVNNGEQNVSKQNRKIVRRSVDKLEPAKTKAART
mmetsp:Transcript_41880/g.72738  ORF Transcript_41880/g.72738 Transcript_41880/m.72738 type:complete len:113 (-) Transcript_41880:169-507(-)